MALVPEKIPQSRPPIILQCLQSGPIKVQTCMSDMLLDLRIFHLKAVRLFKCTEPIQKLLSTMMSLASTLQLCQQALTTLGQTMNKTDVNKFSLSTAIYG